MDSISEEDYQQIGGKYFANHSSYSVTFWKVIGKTRCYIKIQQIKGEGIYDSLGNGYHKFAPNGEFLDKKKNTRLEIHNEKYYLYNGGECYAEYDPNHNYSTVSY